jgi:triphosphoribosyl-dephospho-CoA synthase
MQRSDVRPTLGECAELACTWEARARKPGNVNPDYSFADLTVHAFYRSAGAIAPVIDTAGERSVGLTVLRAIEATRPLVASNTNLGIVLLLAPLAKVPRDQTLAAGIERVLAGLTLEDARHVFAAIRLSNAGGLHRAPEQDIRDEPTLPLREVMALAADRDMIARQYVNGFREVLGEGIDALKLNLRVCRELEKAIIGLHLSLLSQHPDSLIIRKRGVKEANRACFWAKMVLGQGWPGSIKARAELDDLDDWLRADGNARNPGTTADLVTACLFAALREGIIPLPSPYPWSHGDS